MLGAMRVREARRVEDCEAMGRAMKVVADECLLDPER
jgi:hypothetical protein